MATPGHATDITIVTVYIERGIGTPTQVALVEAAKTTLSSAWGTGHPELVDPVAAVEYAAHDGWRGAHLIVNRKRRLLEVWSCGPVRVEALTALSAAAPFFGLAVSQKLGPNSPYLVLERR